MMIIPGQSSLPQLASSILLLVITGLFGGLVGYYFKRREQEEGFEMTRRKLKTALRAEIMSAGKLDQYKDTGVTQKELFQTDIYESSISDLGLLSEEEVQRIVTYYSTVYIYKDAIQSWQESQGTMPNLPNIFGVVLDQREDALRILRLDSTDETEDEIPRLYETAGSVISSNERPESSPSVEGTPESEIPNVWGMDLSISYRFTNTIRNESKKPGSRISTYDQTTKWRPASAGVSLSHTNTTAGTLGTPPLRTEDGVIVVLTTANVAAPNTAQKGDPIIQPATFDDGHDPKDRLGVLWEWSQIKQTEANRTDSALVKVNEDSLKKRDILGLPRFKGWTEGDFGEEYVKSGRTTGVTTSKLIQQDIEISVGGYFPANPGQTATFTGVDVFEAFSAGGDSGSLIGVRRQDGFYGTHLLFAGDSQRTFGIPVQAILEEHGRLEPL